MIDIVTANYFDALGPRAGTRGRLFTEADGRPSMPPAAVVLSHAAWRKHFGLEVGVIGRLCLPPSRDLHHRRRGPRRLHRYPDRLQP